MTTRILPVVLRCEPAHGARARYTLDSLLAAAGVVCEFVAEPPTAGPWMMFADAALLQPAEADGRCVRLLYSAPAWRWFERGLDVSEVHRIDDLYAVLAGRRELTGTSGDRSRRPQDPPHFDLLANAFYFLSSWSERVQPLPAGGRRLYKDSVFARLGVPQDVVDRYVMRLRQTVDAACAAAGQAPWAAPTWPGETSFAVVLSHDIDFLPSGVGDIALQGAKTLLRHLVRQRAPIAAARAMAGLARAAWRRSDPYGNVREIIERERALGVRASYQVAVARRHPADVNYRIENDRVRDALRVITDSGFDLCLHGSYRSTETDHWYGEEVSLLTQRLGRPLGSRQHFLSFDAQRLFSLQEISDIEFDMSMGYPDQPGPRAGFSFPYFPWCFAQERPFRVLQISLALMDVTLQSYLRLQPGEAWTRIEQTLDNLRAMRGAMSVVWHPIVFAGARDPGYDKLFWRLVQQVGKTGGIATDGRTVNARWRERAAAFSSFRDAARPLAQDEVAVAA